MTDLSPAAFAIWDAAWDCPIGDCKSIEDARRHQIAAALRAAADQVISPVPPPCDDFDEHAQGFLMAHVKYRTELLAIADNLDPPNS